MHALLHQLGDTANRRADHRQISARGGLGRAARDLRYDAHAEGIGKGRRLRVVSHDLGHSGSALGGQGQAAPYEAYPDDGQALNATMRILVCHRG